ncbi:MAG TPA: efflux RND transporter periplasmic adaptor subunit [Micropepsaceae bacterium]
MMGYDEPSSKRHATVYGTHPAVKQRNPWPRRILLAVIALGVGGYIAANPDVVQKISSLTTSAPAGGRGAARNAGAVPPVRVAMAETHDVPVVVHTIGTVLANSIVTVKSQVDGPLLSAMFREGQMVKKGDLLFRIDPAPFEAALRQSAAMVERDQAQYDSAKADADRAVMLADRGIVAAQQRDQLVATAKALAATVAADKAAVERAQLNLDYTTIRSPIDGKTGAFIIYPGNQVHASDAAGLVTITQIQPVKISFFLPQGDLPQLQDRMRENQLVVDITTRSDVAAEPAAAPAAATAGASDGDIPVKVDFIGNTVDDKTGTIELRATFQNPDLRLVPGQLVDVSANLETFKNVVTVPRDAVNVGQDGNYVYVIDKDMKAQMRPVKVLYQDQVMAALGSGIANGERVVTDGQLRVTPGTTVAITHPEGETPAKAAPQANTDASGTGRGG